MKKIVSVVLLFSILGLTLAGCGDNGGGTGSRGEINFADAQWESNKLNNAIAGIIAEEVYGYTWRETPGSSTVVHEGIMAGEIDIHMEEWTDNLATYKEDVEAGKLQEIGVNFDDDYQGLYVPRYVIEGDEERGIEASAPDLKYVSDLKKYPDVFPDEEEEGKGRIYGAIPGWEVDDILHNKYEYYDLDENFIYFRPGSDAALAGAITSAYDRGEPIVAYHWEPTWLLGMYDMVLLEDEEPYDEATYKEGGTALPAVKVTIAVSNKFADDENNEDFIEFLKNYGVSSDLLAEGLAHMQETGDEHVEAAKWLLKENSELLDEWLDEEGAKTMKEFLGI